MTHRSEPRTHPRPVQLFTPEYLERCRDLSPGDIVRFLDEFRRLYGGRHHAETPNASPQGGEDVR